MLDQDVDVLFARLEALEARLPPPGWVEPLYVYAARPTVTARYIGQTWSISNGSGEQAKGKTLAEAIAALPEGVLDGVARSARFG